MAEVILLSSTHTTIHAPGLREMSRACRLFPKESQKDIQRMFRRAAEPIADKARQIANTFAASGAFASSISIQGGARGVFLRSNDPGAGPIEFARPGALAITGPGAGEPIGVPAGTPARALFPAIEDKIGEVAENVSDAIERTWMLLVAEVT